MNHRILLILLPTLLVAERTVNYPIISSQANLTHVDLEGPFKTTINRFGVNTLQIKFPFEALIPEIQVKVKNGLLSISVKKNRFIVSQRDKAQARKDFPNDDSKEKPDPAVLLLDKQLQEVQVIISMEKIYHIQALMTNIVSKFLAFERGSSFQIYEGKAVIEQLSSQNITMRQGFRTEITINQISTYLLDISYVSNFTVRKGYIQDLVLEGAFGEVTISENVYVQYAKIVAKEQSIVRLPVDKYAIARAQSRSTIWITTAKGKVDKSESNKGKVHVLTPQAKGKK